MISGAHVIVFSTDADADREFFRNVLGLTGIDAVEGWLIFALPPAELAVHPGEQNDQHELYLICENVNDFIGKMQGLGIECDSVQEQTWGSLTHVKLPGGGRLGVYEPRHERPRA